MDDVRIKDITEKIEKGVREVYTSDNWIKYLSFASRFHHYSLNNQILIYTQNQDATLVAGFQRWKEMGRYVKKNERGIAIVRPMIRPVFDKEGMPVIDPETGKPERAICGFSKAYVFDVEQTEGKEVPQLCKPLQGKIDNFENLVEGLKKATEATVSFEPIEGGALGYFSSAEGKIVVDPRTDEMQQAKTLIHEVAHSLLHRADEENERSRGAREVEAESVAYTVYQYLGFDSTEYSFEYIAGWSSGKELKELKDCLEAIQKASSKIINTLEKEALVEHQPDVKTIKELMATTIEHKKDLQVKKNMTAQVDNDFEYEY